MCSLKIVTNFSEIIAAKKTKNKATSNDTKVINLLSVWNLKRKSNRDVFFCVLENNLFSNFNSQRYDTKCHGILQKKVEFDLGESLDVNYLAAAMRDTLNFQIEIEKKIVINFGLNLDCLCELKT